MRKIPAVLFAAVAALNAAGCSALAKTIDDQLPLELRLEMAKEVAKGLAITNAESSFRRRSRRLTPRSVKKPKFLLEHRRMQASEAEVTEESCDAAFARCIPSEKCESCFWKMQEDGIDWASVNAETPCSDIVMLLATNGRCKDLKYDPDANDAFCNTFNNCVVFEDEDPDADYDAVLDGDPNEAGVDCNSLESCDWEFIHKGFLGDGICHDKVPGCYNTAICGFDGGDCCKDTCKDHGRIKCGIEGFHCRDPESKTCDDTISTNCKTEGKTNSTSAAKAPPTEVACGSDETKYRLVQYDSWGDGWDSTTMTITSKDDPSKVIYAGGLKEGSKGQEFICLSTASSCYSVSLSGGVWGVEVSWEISPMGEGSVSVANGGAPMQCEFPVGGDACDRTCDGKPDEPSVEDPDYISYDELIQCIEDKCMLPIGACGKDATCLPCLVDMPAPYCYANKNYNSVLDCAICSCTAKGSKEGQEYCESKGLSGTEKKKSEKDETGVVPTCNRDQTRKCSNAVLQFSRCSGVDSIMSTVTNFDTNHFGSIDEFEECAHTYNNNEQHGGKKALECMRILADTAQMSINDDDMLEDEGVVDPENAPAEAISALARSLYKNGETFCDCAIEASETCPICKSFFNFKTLLFETDDACKALDEIDCPAWNEYYGYCKEKLSGTFGMIDLDNENQCTFIKEGCNGEGEPPQYPFPAFRRLDCKSELPKASWDFYEEYRKKCIGSDIPDYPSDVTPSSSSKAAPSPTPVTPKQTEPVPSEETSAATAAKKEYVPPPDSEPSSSTQKEKKQYVPPPNSGPSPSTQKEKKQYVPPPDDKPPSSSTSSLYVPQEETVQKKGKKRGFGMFKFIFFCGVCGVGYWYYKKRSDSFEFVRFRRQRNYAGAESEMYGGLMMESSASSFEPPSLPPTPSSLA